MIVTNYPSPLGPDILSFCWSAEVTRGPRDDAGLHAKQGGGKGHNRKEWRKRKPEQGKAEKEEEDEQKMKTCRSAAKTAVTFNIFATLCLLLTKHNTNYCCHEYREAT